MSTVSASDACNTFSESRLHPNCSQLNRAVSMLVSHYHISTVVLTSFCHATVWKAPAIHKQNYRVLTIVGELVTKWAQKEFIEITFSWTRTVLFFFHSLFSLFFLLSAVKMKLPLPCVFSFLQTQKTQGSRAILTVRLQNMRASSYSVFDCSTTFSFLLCENPVRRHLYVSSWDPCWHQGTFYRSQMTADTLTCHCRRSTCRTNINDDSGSATIEMPRRNQKFHRLHLCMKSQNIYCEEGLFSFSLTSHFSSWPCAALRNPRFIVFQLMSPFKLQITLFIFQNS